MNLTTDTFERLEISAPPAGFANPLAAALILTAAALVKLTSDIQGSQVPGWADWAVLAGLTAAAALNFRESWLRARRRDWALILDRRAGRATFIRVRPVRVRPKTVPLEEILSMELQTGSRTGAEFRYQPRFALTGGRSWHVPDLWGDRARIPETAEAVNRWLRAAPPQAEPEAKMESA